VAYRSLITRKKWKPHPLPKILKTKLKKKKIVTENIKSKKYENCKQIIC
jgi:hypothetical protein